MGKNQESDNALSGGEVRIINLSGGEIPILSFGKIADVDSDGNLEIIKPDADSIPASKLVITGPTIIPNGKPATAFPAELGKIWVRHDTSEDDPVNGDFMGTVEDEWFGQVGKSGFVVHGIAGGRSNVSPFRAGLFRVGTQFWVGTRQGIPPAGSEFTSGPTFRFQWKSRITTTGFRDQQNGVCDFDGGPLNHPTKGFPAPSAFFVLIAGTGVALSSMVGGVVATTMSSNMDVDIITSPMDFSAASPTFTPIQSLPGVNIGTFKYQMSFETRFCTQFQPTYGIFVPAGHGIENIHGVRINPGSEAMNDSHNATFSSDNLSAVSILGV